MQVKVFSQNNIFDLEKSVNEFLKTLPNSDIHKVETHPVKVQCGDIRVETMAIFVWLTTDAKEV